MVTGGASKVAAVAVIRLPMCRATGATSAAVSSVKSTITFVLLMGFRFEGGGGTTPSHRTPVLPGAAVSAGGFVPGRCNSGAWGRGHPSNPLGSGARPSWVRPPQSRGQS